MKEISKVIFNSGLELLRDQSLHEFIEQYDLQLQNLNYLYLDIEQKISKNNMQKLKDIKESNVIDNFYKDLKDVLVKFVKIIDAFKDKLSQMEIYKEMIKNQEKEIKDKGNK